MKKAVAKANLNGARNGDATSVAIMVAPSGNRLASGCAKIAYHSKKKISLGEGESAEFNCPIKLDETAMQMIGIDAAKTANIEITLSASVKETGKKFIRERKKRLSKK